MINFPISILNRLQPRTEILLKALASERVDSKEKLENLWKRNPKCKYSRNGTYFLSSQKI